MRGKVSIIFILLFLVFFGCTTTVTEIGSDVFNQSNFDIAYLDSVTINASTIQGDTFPTSNVTRLLVGHIQDPVSGSITAKTIFQVGVRIQGTDYPVVLDRLTTEFQSATLWLQPDKYSYADTTKAQTISVYRVNREMKLFSNYLYNKSKFKTDDQPLGSLTFTPKPKHADSLEIPLANEFGRALMTLAQHSDPTVAINLNFIQYLRGLAIVPDTTVNGCIMGFTLNPQLRIYYTDKSVVPAVTRFASFKLASNFYFNHITAWRDPSSPLQSLHKFGDAVSSKSTEHLIYTQGGVGLQSRLDMPYLRTFLYGDRQFNFTRVILQIMPIQPSIRHDPLPSVLSIYAVDQYNHVIPGYPSYPGRLVKDYDLGVNTRYEADITSFVNSQVQNDLFNQNGLLITPDDATYRSSVTGTALGDTRNSYQMKIKLYYLTLSNSTN